MSADRFHGSRGFCNLRLAKVDGGIGLDPHVTGACVIVSCVAFLIAVILTRSGTAGVPDG
ncbi:MAG: hypothetical protein ACRDTD_01095 [Pseudonocardiaceae bacterium]